MRNRTNRPLLFVHSSNEMYGADRVVLDVLHSLSPQDLERARVWLPADIHPGIQRLSDALEAEGISVEIVKMPVLRRKYMHPMHAPGLIARFLICLFRLIVLRPQLLYMTTSAMLPFAPASWMVGIPHRVLHCQEIWAGPEAKVLAALCRFATHTISISKAVEDALVRHARLRNARIIVNGHREISDIPWRPVQDSHSLSFLVASRWNSWKGHETLFKAWDTDEPFGLLKVAGGPPSTGDIVDVATLRSGLRRPDTVQIVGETGDIPGLIDSVDFVIVPSDKAEPFGLIAIEAFARGRAVIGSDAGGLASIVSHGHDGYKFPLGDWQALRDILKNVTKQAAIRMGIEGRQTYTEKYSAKRFASDFGHVWAECLESGGSKL